MTKILHLTHSLPETKYPLVINIIDAIREIENVKVIECYLYKGNPEWYKGDGVFLDINRSGFSLFEEITKIKKLCTKHNIDAIFTQRSRPALVASIVSKQLSLPPIISVYHGLGEFDSIKKKLQASMLMKNNQLIAVSDMVKKDILNSVSAFKEESLTTIYNGINKNELENSLLSKEISREELHLPQEAYIIGSIGRCVTNKGFDLLLESFKDIAREKKNLHLAIIGEGKELKSLMQLAKGELEKRIHFCGFQESASKYLKAFDLCVMPSRSEGLPLVSIECFFSKTPIITSHAGGLPEAMGEDGIIFKSHDGQALTKALERTLKMTKDELIEYTEKLFERALNTFTHIQMKENYQSCIKTHLSI